MRVDAARNRERILTAARELVAAHGTDASMDAIAARAGVAVGTLYRHHPTKAALVAAVVDDGIARIAELAEATATRMAAGSDSWRELTGLLRAIVERHAVDKAVKAAAAALGAQASSGREGIVVPAGGPDSAADPERGSVARARADADGASVAAGSAAALRAESALDQVVRLAREAGAARPDLTVNDLVILVGGTPAGAQQRERYLDILLAGLAAPTTGPGERT